MKIYEYGNIDSSNVLIQPVDDHDLSVMDNEIAAIKETAEDFRLIAVKVNNWNDDLSPWEAPAVFGNAGFGGRAGDMLSAVTDMCRDRSKAYYIGGYSLAGLFALWAACQTDTFKGVAAASPSMWFPGFTEYMADNAIKCDAVYLSLGDKEAKARNPVMATVADKMAEAKDIIKSRGVDVTFEWNSGNHFKESDLRTARAFAFVLGNT